MTRSGSLRALPHRFQQRPQLSFGCLVLLIDGEFQRGFEHRTRFGRLPCLQQQFPKEYARHHPVRFLSDTKLEVRSCFRFAAFCYQRLRQAESEELVVRFSCDQRLKLFGAG